MAEQKCRLCGKKTEMASIIFSFQDHLCDKCFEKEVSKIFERKEK